MTTQSEASPAEATADEERLPSLWEKATLSQLKHLVAGGVAGAVSRTAVSPLERMKILYQLQVRGRGRERGRERERETISPQKVEAVKGERKFQSLASSLRLIGREEGVRGYFKGNGTNVMRIIPYVAVQFAAYEEYKKVNISLSPQSLVEIPPPLPLSLSLPRPLPPPVARDIGGP